MALEKVFTLEIINILNLALTDKFISNNNSRKLQTAQNYNFVCFFIACRKDIL
jgi:hypothetical protein